MNSAFFDSESDDVVSLVHREQEDEHIEECVDSDTASNPIDGHLVARENNSVQHRAKATVYVWVGAFIAALGGILFGYDVGIISGALLQLKCDFSLSKTEQSWTVSSMLVGAIVASLTGGFIVDFIGRQKAIIVNSCIFTVGAAILAGSVSFEMLIIGRLIVGFGVSLSAIAECIYISEISPPHRRGMLVSLNEFGITLGFLLAYVFNLAFVDVPAGWRYMFGLSIIPAAIQGIAMIFLPPSPRYLMMKGKENEAKCVLAKLRGRWDVGPELCQIQEMISLEKVHSLADICSVKGNMRYRMFVAISLVLLQQFTGQPNVLYYSATIFEQIGFSSDVAATRATLFLGLTKVVTTGIALLLIDKAGRRRFLLLGAAGMMITLTAMGTALAKVAVPEPDQLSCVDNESHVNVNATEVSTSVKFTSLMSLLLFVACYAFSFGPVSWLILSEIFPVGLRGRAVAISTVANWGGNLIVSLTFLPLLNSFGIAPTFLSYAGICLCSVVFIFIFVPETKNRTLEEINQELNAGPPSLKSRCTKLRFQSQLKLRTINT